MAEYRRGNGPHFASLPFELLDNPEADAYTIATYAAVKSYADFGSDEGARPGDGVACKRAGCSERIFRDRRDRLRRMGWLEWEQRPGRTNLYVVHSSPVTPAPHAGVEEGDPGTTCRTTPAPHAAPPRHQVPTTKSQLPRAITEVVVIAASPLNPPGESLPVVHDSPPPTPPAAIPANADPATTPDQPAPARDLGDVGAAITRVIIAANRAMTGNESIDQSQLKPIPTKGRGRQDVLDWIADGVPIALILDTVADVVSRYRPDRARGQISSMGYFRDAIDQANELRLAREAEGHEKRNDNGRVPAAGRGGRETPAKPRVSKYDSLTIRSGEGGAG